MKRAVIVIPTYNESENIKAVIDGVYRAVENVKNWDFHVLVVDSKSPDKTASIVHSIQKTNKRVHLLETDKEGIGKAYTRGFQYALSEYSPDVIFEMDADYSHDPTVLPKFIEKIEEGADFVIGSRYIKGGSIPDDWGLNRKIFSVLGNVIVRLGFMKLSISDWTGGYRAIRSDIVKKSITHVDRYTGYVFQIALLDFAIKHHAVIREVPIQFTDRKYGVSKINSGTYIQNIFTYIFNHSSFAKYVIVGLTGFVIDFGLLYILYRRLGVTPWLAQVISGESAIISNFILNNFWAFSHLRIKGNPKAFWTSAAKFNGVAVGSIIIQSVGVGVFDHFFGPKYVFVFKAFLILFVIIPYSYVLYNRVVWKNKKRS